ncbi:transglutaminase family protein [Psychromonas sp. L1A2]|uniref:transglutaminase family protein n=1 Tax=Psychromonas sp. L1A2 TaxID=2686356 RepID=UPI00135B1822|nr:DUF3488 and transglutaminase-like domain-containing protein [Psychromonas sp. L1A2]
MPEFLTRQSLSLIVFSYALVLVLLADQVNALLIIFGVLCAAWRIALFTGRVTALNKAITNSISVVCIAIIVLMVYKLGVLNILVHVILLGFSLKFLELKSVRDVHFFVNTGLVLVAVFLVFNHTILMASAAAIVACLLLMILLSIHGAALNTKPQLKILSKILVLSLPLAIILFLVLPRLPSMWQMPLQNKATTGLTDSVSPGSIAELSQSSALAFRASFSGEPPKGQARYWRVLTLDEFDGKTWSQSSSLKREERRVRRGQQIEYELIDKQSSYQLILEPHYKHYVPSLDFAYSSNDSTLLSDFSLRSIDPVYKRQAFEIEQYKQVDGFANTAKSLQKYTQLPNKIAAIDNPKTREWIDNKLAAGIDKYTILEQLLTMFNKGDFRYTLKPPLLGGQQIDDFLFSSQAGFCVHYASTYLYVARVLDVPARMVAGYLGGEWDNSNAFLSVRQYDAHAWVEIWKDKQWVRVDPTAYVSPERVEQGILQSLDDQSEFLSGQYLSLRHWQNNQLFNQLTNFLDRADYFWAVWVINYDNQKQLEILKRLLSNIPWLNLSMLILLLLFLGATITALWIFKPWQSEKLSIEDRLFNQLYEKVTEKYLTRSKGQTVVDYCKTLGELKVNAQPSLLKFATLYNQIKYQASLTSSQKSVLIAELVVLKKAINKQCKR